MARSHFRPVQLFIPLAALAFTVGAPAIAASAATPGTWAATGSMSTARFDGASIALAGGPVLAAGGSESPATAELYSPATGTWSLTGSMSTGRISFTLTVLPGGRVLAVGGGTTTGGLSSAELYNPATGTWSPTGSMTVGRTDQTATLLPDGKVLVAGGLGAGFTALSSAELYNPATGTWSPTGSMTSARADQTATLLPDGKVLVAGGQTSAGTRLSSAELYNPATGTWSPTGSMTVPRTGQRATLLSTGNVLVTAGIQGTGSFAELYSPAAGTWSAASGGLGTCLASMDCRVGSSATLLGDGQVLVAGGLSGTASNPASTIGALLYNPSTNIWTATGSMTTARDDQMASLLSNGQVLVVGGATFVRHLSTPLASAELFTS